MKRVSFNLSASSTFFSNNQVAFDRSIGAEILSVLFFVLLSIGEELRCNMANGICNDCVGLVSVIDVEDTTDSDCCCCT